MCSNLKILRVKKGLNRKQLAQKSGLSVPTIKRAENKCLNMKVKTLKTIAEALDINFLELIED